MYQKYLHWELGLVYMYMQALVQDYDFKNPVSYDIKVNHINNENTLFENQMIHILSNWYILYICWNIYMKEDVLQDKSSMIL